MTANEHLANAKNQPVPNKEQIRRSRITAFLLGTAILITLVFLVFAFIQKAHADKALAELQQTKWELQQCRAAK